MTDIRIYFILPEGVNEESEASNTMIQAYESCRQLVDHIFWIKESELLSRKFNKLDYIVFETFQGKNFDKLVESKCARIIGPLAVSVCLTEGKPIPNFQWPILNVAMYDCIVTCSQISKKEKEEIKNKVQLMGGQYTPNLTESVTHLVCNGTKSEKYMLAAQKKLKCMLPSWVTYVWEKSQLCNVSAKDTQVLDKYCCPPFHNLIICSTGISSSKERTKLGEIINANGGKLVAKLNLAETDILICHGPAGTSSDKFKAAKRSPHLSCVRIEWIFDSAEAGYALPHEKYYVKASTSTPIKDGENADPNFSSISAIGAEATMRRSTIDETANATVMTTANATVMGHTRNSTKRKASEDLVEKIDIKKVKRAGQFLDGCSVLVAGFTPEVREKLNKVVNLSGATRYDDLSERVTHVVVGDPRCHEIKLIKSKGLSCAVVSVQWLLDSIEQQQPANEIEYLIKLGEEGKNGPVSDVASPLSKKAFNLLKNANIRTVDEQDTTTVPEPEHHEEDALTQQYLKKTSTEPETEDTLALLLKGHENATAFQTRTSSKSNEEEFTIKSRLPKNSNQRVQVNESIDFKPHETSTQISQVTTDTSANETDVNTIFDLKKFFIAGYTDENRDTLEQFIREAGGQVVEKNFKGVADYAVVEMSEKEVKLPVAVQEMVNEFWILECCEEGRICETKYYHKPIVLPSKKPLLGSVVTISVYTNHERSFLQCVIEGLGGTYQEQFSRKKIEAKNVEASTHLLSPEASGKKYEAALKWNLPVISKDWLMECLNTGNLVALHKYLIGESKAPEVDPSSNNLKRKASSKNSSTEDSKSSANNSTISRNTDVSLQSHSATPKNSKNNEGQSSVTEQRSVTPRVNNAQNKDAVHTPQNQVFNFDRKDTPDACSQVTPINKIIQDCINDKVLPTPPSPKTYYPWDPKTPDTPIGAFIRPNPSPRLRKEMQRYLNSFPDFIPPPERRLSTPLSELKKRLRDKVMGRGMYGEQSQDEAGPSKQVEEPQRNIEEPSEMGDVFEADKPAQSIPPENPIVNQKLQELQEMVMASGSGSASRRPSRTFESTRNPPAAVTSNTDPQTQVFTVDWDYGGYDTQSPSQKIFMISGLELSKKEQLAKCLQDLGSTVIESQNYDSTCTHLICPKPGRNEKTLASMAAGKWILHTSYVEKSVEAGKLLNEEEFEFGNPKARQNIHYDDKDSSVHFWRREIKRRGYGAFNDMRAIVVAERRDPIIKVIEAGGGVVVNVTPPFDVSIHATHCLIEAKMVKDFSLYVPLAEQGIKIVNTIYINDFLRRTGKSDTDYILPYFTKFY